jgi:3-methyl-2-oxobutanoate hydroxymethyltransferase
MPRIIDFSGREVERTTTVGSLIASRQNKSKLAQVTADSAEEAAAAEEVGIEMLVCRSQSVSQVRDGSKRSFVTAAIDFSGAVTDDELLAEAFAALSAGADAIITSRSFELVERLASEEIPVMGHLGFVPRKSTWYGGVRAVGRTALEAECLWDRFRRLEDCGAFGVECELIPSQVMGEINSRTGLVTVSLGSGPDADVIFLFTSDICGRSSRLPRHARAYGDLSRLDEQIRYERIKALAAFRADVEMKLYPQPGEIVAIDEGEFLKFIDRLDGK